MLLHKGSALRHGCCRDEAGWAGTQHMVGMDWETGTAASQATARSSHHPFSVVLLWSSCLEENFPTGLAAVPGPLSHYKPPTVLLGRWKQPESEEQWEPQTTYHGITNACTIQGDTLLRPYTGTDISEKVFWFIVFIPMLDLGQWPSCLCRFLLARCSFHSYPAVQGLYGLGWQCWLCIFYFFIDKAFHSSSIYIMIFLLFHLQPCA